MDWKSLSASPSVTLSSATMSTVFEAMIDVPATWSIVPPASMLRVDPSMLPRRRSFASVSVIASAVVSTATMDWKSLSASPSVTLSSAVMSVVPVATIDVPPSCESVPPALITRSPSLPESDGKVPASKSDAVSGVASSCVVIVPRSRSLTSSSTMSSPDAETTEPNSCVSAVSSRISKNSAPPLSTAVSDVFPDTEIDDEVSLIVPPAVTVRLEPSIAPRMMPSVSLRTIGSAVVSPGFAAVSTETVDWKLLSASPSVTPSVAVMRTVLDAWIDVPPT